MNLVPTLKGILRRSLPLLTVLLLATAVHAQEVRNIEGRKFIVHRVEQGQTLFAISRNYAVPVEDIMGANPGSEAGLAIGQELLIPHDAINKKEARNAPTLAADGELLHTVAKRETMFGISRTYNVDINALMARNPELTEGLREGMVVVIPVTKVDGQPGVVTRPAVQERLLEHIVQPGETLYSLGKLYVVPVELIQAANNGLPEGLKAGSTVLIPLRIGTEPTPEPSPVDTVALRERYKVALMLPFSTARNDSLMEERPSDPRFYELSLIAAQFYAGALMAIDSLATMGLRADVTVMDQGDEPAVWEPLMRQREVGEQDLFIGPFHRTAIEQLARTNTRAHIVCPVPQANKLLLGHPRVSKVTPTRSDMVKQTARYVAQRHARDNIILIRPEIESEVDLQEQMRKALEEALVDQPLKFRDSLLIITTAQREMTDPSAHFDLGRLNVVVVPSEDIEFASALVARLKGSSSKYRIALVGLESWLRYETIAATDLDLLGFLFASGSYVDPEDHRVQTFTEKFRERFNNDVDEYAFLGFDVTFFYLKALMARGTDLTSAIQGTRSEPLHMGFRMSRSGPENGFRNEYAVMLQMKDLRLVKAP